jgi:phosphoribosylanthranilate isomerase
MRPQDVTAALDSGADALGFVVGSPSSPRNLELSEARRLMEPIPLFATKVAVTSATDPRTVLKLCSKLKPDAVQLHQYGKQMIQSIRKKGPDTRIILATPIRDHSSIRKATETSNYSDAVLADTAGSGPMGGTGRTHDWRLTASLRNRIYPHPLILAGGLNPGNVRSAIRKVNPFAVDVSTGVEKRIGMKDNGKIRAFINNAKGVS